MLNIFHVLISHLYILFNVYSSIPPIIRLGCLFFSEFSFRIIVFLYEHNFYVMTGVDQLLKFYLCFQWQKNLRVPLVKFFICITSSETHSSFMTQPLSSLSSSGCISSTTSWMEAVSISQTHLHLLELHLHTIHILQGFFAVFLHYCAGQDCL